MNAEHADAQPLEIGGLTSAAEPERLAETVIAASGPAAALHRAKALHDEGKFGEAEALLREAIASDPCNWELHNARGIMFAAMGRPLEALGCYREAIACNPTQAGTWTNLGNTLTQLRLLTTAVGCHQRALALRGSADALLLRNLGISLAEAGKHGDAIVAFSRALEINPRSHLTRFDRACVYLALGNYRQGWADYEVRRISGQLSRRELPGAYWKGEPYAGKRLVLLAEQGFGDILWVVRYLPRVKALGGELIIESQRELVSLIQSMGIAHAVIPRGDPLPAADLHCYWCSLPGLFTPDFAAIPNSPYLVAPRDRMAKFQASFAAAGRRMKVGIVWSGSLANKRNHQRAQPLARFVPAFAQHGVQLYSLQKGPCQKELTTPSLGSAVIDLAPLLDDFADTAAAIAGLDLIIMTDSAVAHLAGAMGKPVWVLLGHVVHWLWLLERTDSPWYPSMRLFRPRGEGDWDYVFDAASAALMNMVAV